MRCLYANKQILFTHTFKENLEYEKQSKEKKTCAIFFRLLKSIGCCFNGEECLHSQKVGHIVSEYLDFTTNNRRQRQRDTSKTYIFCMNTTRSNFQVDIILPGYYLSKTCRDDRLILWSSHPPPHPHHPLHLRLSLLHSCEDGVEANEP